MNKVNLTENNEFKEITPKEYFESLKDKKQSITDKELQLYYENCLKLVNKYNITGQTSGLRKLIFHVKTIEKERELVKLGVNNFIYRDDVEEYIDKVSNKVVKIIELENYEREIPDEVVEVISKTKNIFDQLYVVFTDYTGEIEKRVEKERRDKDPILFGTFQDKQSRSVIDRFYFLADWEDEYCDLTLDKMVNEYKQKENKDILFNFNTPVDIDEIVNQLNNMDKNNRFIIINNKNSKNKKSLFKKVRSILGK